MQTGSLVILIVYQISTNIYIKILVLVVFKKTNRNTRVKGSVKKKEKRKEIAFRMKIVFNAEMVDE